MSSLYVRTMMTIANKYTLCETYLFKNAVGGWFMYRQEFASKDLNSY